METQRKELYKLLGELPPRDRQVTSKIIDISECKNYILESLILDLNGIEPVPAYFIRPKTVKGRVPVILFSHSHGGNYKLGKDELIHGSEFLLKPSYAEALTASGYAAICIDAWVFGERRGRTETELFKEMLWEGRVMWGMMVYDSLKVLDYLEQRNDVDNERIGAMGISMGGTMSWWVAALNPKVKVCVDLCSLTDYNSLITQRRLDYHSFYYYVPGLLKKFSTAQINSLITPRAHLSLAGIYDPLTPPEGLERVNCELEKAYLSFNACGRWRLIRYPSGHYENTSMRKEVIEFFSRWL